MLQPTSCHKVVDPKHIHVPNYTLVRKTDYTMKEKNYNITLARKKAIDTIEMYNDVHDSLLSRSYSKTDEPPHWKSSKRRLKHRDSKREGGDLSRLPASSKAIKHKYDSHLQPESKNEELLTHRRNARQCRVRDFGTECESLIDRAERSRSICDKELPVIHTVNDLFLEVLDYRTYHLIHKLLYYDNEVSRTVAK